MPIVRKPYSRTARGTFRSKPSGRLAMPAVGMESEFNIYLDGKEILPEAYWKHPSAFIDVPMLKREKTSGHIPTGGAVYFDRGVIEVVTAPFELAPGCAARVVRSLWEQVGFLRDQLTSWGHRTGHDVRMKAYSTHYNISFELRRREQSASRNIKKLALLLAYILPIPVMILGANRRSTGVGVRPRGDRIEVTVDFTPDPGLMIATATLIVGVVREVLSWPSYDIKLLDELRIPTVAGVIPGKHTTRKGWLTKDFHYPQSPYTSDIDQKIWNTREGRTLSLREIAIETAWFFRRSIRKYSDPFSLRMLFAILEGRAPSMLELLDRPAAYEDVGRLCRWGMVIYELKHYNAQQSLIPGRSNAWNVSSMEDFLRMRDRERSRELAALSDLDHRRGISQTPKNKKADAGTSTMVAREPRTNRAPVSSMTGTESGTESGNPSVTLRRRRKGESAKLFPKRKDEYLDRRRIAAAKSLERRGKNRRAKTASIPFPDRRLTRSAYETVFLKLVSGGRLKIGHDTYTPVGMKGWYHAVFRRDSDGRERLITIDQLLKRLNDWQ